MSEHDEQYPARWLALLAEGAPEPSSSIERAMADGRSRRRRRRYAVSAAVAVAATLAVAVPVMLPRGAPATPSGTAPSATPSGEAKPAKPATPTSCRAQLLPAPGGTTNGMVSAADPTGRYQVGYVESGSGRQLAVWNLGHLTTTRVPGPVPDVTGVNFAGTVTGYVSFPQSADIPPGDTNVWVYRSGQVSFLPRPAGDTGAAPGRGGRTYIADGINAAGDIVGFGITAGSAATNQMIVWPGNSPGAPRVVTAPAGTTFAAPAAPRAASIEDDGSVYSTVRTGSAGGSTDAYVWSPAGVATRLTVPGGLNLTPVFENDGGLTGLTGTDPGGVGTWSNLNLSTGRVARYPDGFTPRAVDKWGWSVGADANHRPEALFDGHLVRLPMPAGSSASDASPTSISDAASDTRGQVTIGGQVTIAGRGHAALWTCG